MAIASSTKWLLKECFLQLSETAQEFKDDQCSLMAAALAYYAVFSLAPLIVIAISLVGWVFDPSDVRGEVQRQIKVVAGEAAAEEIQSLVSRAAHRRNDWMAGLIGGGALLLGASGVFLQIQTALNRAWDVTPAPDRSGILSFLTQRLLSFSMILVIAFLLLTSLAITAVLAAFGEYLSQLTPPGAGKLLMIIIHSVVSFGVITVLFASMFKFLPDAQIEWRAVWFGALTTAVLFFAGKYVLGLCLSQSNLATSFGQAGSLAFILTWIYYSSMIFLFGAEFSQVWARRRGWSLKPVDGAVQVVNKPIDVAYRNSASDDPEH